MSSWCGKRIKLLATEPLVQRLAGELSQEAQDLAQRWGQVPGATRDADAAAPGTVLDVVSGVGLVVATSGCPLLLKAAQLEGKSAATGGQLLQQLQAQPGDQLGQES